MPRPFRDDVSRSRVAQLLEYDPLTGALSWRVSRGKAKAGDAALALGCTCPVIDNHYGRGVPQTAGENYFWYAEDCPVHCPPLPMEARDDHAR